MFLIFQLPSTHSWLTCKVITPRVRCDMGLSWRNPYSNFVFCSLNMRLTRSILFLGNRLLQWWGQGEVKFHHLLLVVCKITWSVPVRCFLSVPCVMSSHPSQIFVSHYHNFNVHNPHYLSRWNLVGSLKGRGIDKSLKKFGFLLIISSLLMRLQINLYRKRLPGLSHSGSSLWQTSHSYHTTVQ